MAVGDLSMDHICHRESVSLDASSECEACTKLSAAESTMYCTAGAYTKTCSQQLHWACPVMPTPAGYSI